MITHRLVRHAFTADDNTLFLLNGTSLQDESNYKRKITNIDVTIDTTVHKNGASSLKFASSSYLEIREAGFMNFGNSDFTIEAWMKPIFSSMNGTRYLLSYTGDLDCINPMSITLDETYLCADVSLVDAQYGTTITEVVFEAENANDWVHIALVRNNNTLSIYRNGIKGTLDNGGSVAVETAFFALPPNYPLIIGRSYDTRPNQNCFVGNIENLRISNVARYTSNFTPPTTLLN